jgi:predicted N-acetyltransferase YhbS
MKLTTLTDLSAWEELLNRGFPVSEDESFFDDFPVWKIQDPSIARVGLQDDSGRWIAAGGLRECTMISSPQDECIGVVGGIVTDADFRGQGLAGQIVAELLTIARKRDLAAVILFGSMTPLYQRLGFTPFGRQARIPLHSEFKGNITQQLKMSDRFPQAIAPILLKRSSGLRITQSDIAWISAHKNIEWITTGPEEKPDAFAAIGKGIDLQGIVHEVGGDPQAIRNLLCGVAHSSPSFELLASARLISELGITSQEGIVEPIGLAQSLNPRGELLLSEGSPIWFWGIDGA